MTSPKSAVPGASAGASSSRTQRKGNPRQIKAGARTAEGSTGATTTTPLPDEFRTLPDALDIREEISGGLTDSIRLARHMVNDESLPAYVRVRAMDFFVKNQHLAEADDPGGKSLRDEFMELMAEIRSVPKVVTPTLPEELEEEDEEPRARFEAAPS